MLTRRELLRRAAIIGGGSALGLSSVTLGQRLLIPSGGGGVVAPEWNEEFNGDGSVWTVAGANAVSFNDVVPGAVAMESGMVIVRPSVPPAPFTVTAFYSVIEYDDIDTIFANATLAIGGAEDADSTGPKFYGLEWDVDQLGSIAIYDGLFADYAATPTHLGTKTNETAGLALQVPHYQRMIVRSGTDIDLLYSFDGETWITYATGRNPGIELEAVLLVSFGCETAWDWVRFS